MFGLSQAPHFRPPATAERPLFAALGARHFLDHSPLQTGTLRTCYSGTSTLKDPRYVPLAEIHLHDGESLESALKRFKRKVLQEEIIKDIKRHAFYLKPGQKKRVKSAEARKRARKKKRSWDGDSDQNRS
jgi:small subunit ribosomal protein S21